MPSKGTGSTTTVNIQKHGGAVAITQRAQAVINNDNPFQRLVTQMGQKKLFDENDMIADVIEAVTATTYAGVDFGLRAGTPPLSSTNPVDFLATTISTFEALITKHQSIRIKRTSIHRIHIQRYRTRWSISR